MKGRFVQVLGLLGLLLAVMAPAASAVSGYGPEECDPNGGGGNDPVVECEEVPTDVESGATENAGAAVDNQNEKLAFTGSSTQTLALFGTALIGGGALFVLGTRRASRQ